MKSADPSTVVDLYTLQLIHDGGHVSLVGLNNVPALMAEAEENLTDLLPDGYRARIRRWDTPDPDEGDTDE